MSTISELLARFADPATGAPAEHTIIAWELRVAGLGERDAELGLRAWRWVSDTAPPADTDGVRYFGGVAKVGGYEATFDGIAGLSAAGGTSVSVMFKRGHDGDNRAGALLRTEASWSTRILESVHGETDPPFDVELEDIDLLAADGGVFHIGQEAFEYDGVDAEAGTAHVVTRGCFGTLRQSHLVDPGQGWAPWVHAEPVDWGDRPAVLLKTVVRRDGSRFPVALEHVAGYLVGDAEHDMAQLKITLVPWAAVIDRQIGDKDAVARLVPEWKVFAGDDPGAEVVVTDHYPLAAWYSLASVSPAFPGDPTNEIRNVSAEAHGDLFDVTAPAGDGRRGDVIFDGVRYVVSDHPTAESITFTTDHHISVARGSIEAYSAPATVTRRIDLREAPGAVAADDGSGGAAIRWPSAAVLHFNRTFAPQSARTADARAGHIPGFLDLRLLMGPEPMIELRPTSGRYLEAPELLVSFGDATVMWYPIDLADPSDPVHAAPVEQNSPPRWPAARRLATAALAGDRAERVAYPIRRVMGGHWVTGQRWIHVDRGDIWPATPFMTRVAWPHPSGSERTARFVITAVTAASDLFEGVPGFLLEVREEERWQHEPFGDILQSPGESTIRPISMQARNLAEALLQVLTSVDGRGTNGPYDKLPAGAAVPLEYVDVDSFTSYPMPGGVAIEPSRLVDGRKLRDALKPILGLIGAQLGTRLDRTTGKRRIVLERAGLPATPTLAADGTPIVRVGHIADGHWYQDPPARVVPDRRTLNGLDLKYNHDITGEPQSRAIIVDRGIVQAQRGRDRLVEEDLVGVRIPADAATADSILRGPAQARFAAYGQPRQVIEGRVPSNRAAHLDVGAVVTVSHAQVHAPDGTQAIQDRVGRLIRFVDDPDRGVAELRVEISRGNAKPYAPSLLVIGAPDAVTITVERQYYGPLVRPDGGADLRDVDLFRQGQRVMCVRRGSRSSVYRRIVTIDRDADEVVLDGAHDLVAPHYGSIDIPPWGEADALDRQLWAFFGRPGSYI